jgi:DNA polymerase III delta prime subunit
MSIKNNLWVEAYRPATLDGYVFVDDNQQAQIEGWVKEKTIPHLLFSGAAGTGKTTLAKILINEIGVNEYDILEVNASRNNTVEFIKNTIVTFVSTMPFGNFKVVLLDEADYMSPNAQAVLRGIMETYAATARFILTCNYPHKVIPAIHSRSQGFHIDKIDHTEFTARVATILITEGIDPDLDILDSYVKATYPDLRKCIGLVQANSMTGELLQTKSSGSGSDFKAKAVDLFKAGDIKNARKTLCDNITATDVDGIITWAYNNLDLWSATDEGQDQAILYIRDAAARVPLVTDPEINVAAMFVELSSIE